MRTPLHNHLTACVGLKTSRRKSCNGFGYCLSCLAGAHGQRSRSSSGRAACDPLGSQRDGQSGREAPSDLLGASLLALSLPAQRSPEGYLAWLSKPCPAMDREERAQHLLAFSKWVPNQKKKRVRPARQQPATSTPEERRAAFDFVSAAMDKVRTM